MATKDFTKKEGGANGGNPVSIVSPVGSYGDVSTINPRAVFQILSNYASTTNLNVFQILSGVANVVDGKFNMETSANANSFGSLVSQRTLIYKYGEGIFCRFSAIFPDPGVADSRVFGGFISSTDQVLIGYDGVDFGLQYLHDGLQEIRELQITTSASGAESVTVTIDNDPFIVPVTSGTVQFNAEEIAVGLSGFVALALWVFTAVEDMVIMSFGISEPKTGTFSVSSTGTLAGSFTTIESGIVPTEDFVAQSDWSVNKCPELDVTKRNYFQIKVNGALEFYVGEETSGNPKLVHRIPLVNEVTLPPFTNPTFRVGWFAANVGNTSVVRVQGDGLAGMREGLNVITEAARSSFNTDLSLDNSLSNLITIRSRQVFGNKRNLAEVILLEATLSHDGSKSVVVQIIKNATLDDNSNFQYEDKGGSIIATNTNITPVSGGTVIATATAPPSGSVNIDLALLKEIMQNQDTITLAAFRVSGSSPEATGTITWREDL